MRMLAVETWISYSDFGRDSLILSEGGFSWGCVGRGTSRTFTIFRPFGCFAFSIFCSRGERCSFGKFVFILSRLTRIVSVIANIARIVGIQYFHLNSDLLSDPTCLPIKTSTSCARPCLPDESIKTTAFSLRSSVSNLSESETRPVTLLRLLPLTVSSNSF